MFPKTPKEKGRGPRVPEAPHENADERRKRLAEALRANLKKRKDQARARTQGTDSEGDK